MQQTAENTSTPTRAAAGFDRPLLLTPKQDLAGYLTKHLGHGILTAITCTSMVAVFLIFVYIVWEAWPFFARGYAWELFTSPHWYPEHGDESEFGGLALIAGSAYVTIGAMIVAVPTGLMTAIFLSDIIPFWLRQYVKPIVELLAAIPSVAYGFFAIMVMSPWLQNTLGLSTGRSVLNASVLLGVMAFPTIVSISEDALSSIGRELREGSYALGANRAEALVKVVIPAARGGIVAACILGIMRAVGETMVVWMACGNASQIPSPWWDITQPMRTLTATIAGDMSEASQGSVHYHSLFALGAVLLVLTFVLNLVSEHFLTRNKRRLGGASQ